MEDNQVFNMFDIICNETAIKRYLRDEFSLEKGQWIVLKYYRYSKFLSLERYAFYVLDIFEGKYNLKNFVNNHSYIICLKKFIKFKNVDKVYVCNLSDFRYWDFKTRELKYFQEV